MFFFFGIIELFIFQAVCWSHVTSFGLGGVRKSPRDRAVEMLKQMNLTEKLVMM